MGARNDPPYTFDYTAVQDVANGEVVDWDEYGIEEDGPIPDVCEGDLVSVPQSTIVLSNNQVNTIANAINNVVHDDQQFLIKLITIVNYLVSLRIKCLFPQTRL